MADAAPLELPPLRLVQRRAILAGIAGVTALAWLWLVWMARGMDAMGTMGDAMAMRAWTTADFAMMLAMWVVMMVGMMLPSAAPMALVYARVAHQAEGRERVLPPTAVFLWGYVLAWGGFSIAATVAQWALERAALLSPRMAANSVALGGALLVVAGLYQLTPWKDACLRHCRAPAHFFSRHFRPGASGALRLGLVHGAYCLGCCWVLMGLLFVGGVMNLLWIAGIAFFVLLEKALPAGAWGGRVAGGALVAAGLATWAGLA